MMGGAPEVLTQRLRRLAAALGDKGEAADALALDTLSAWKWRTPSYASAAAALIRLRHIRDADRAPARLAAHAPHSSDQPEIVRLFDALPQFDREVLALIVIDGFAYDEAAAILGIAVADLIERLSRARERLARAAADAPPVLLRLVK